MIWNKPNEGKLQEERDKGFLEAVFCPLESIEEYKKKYSEIRPGAKNHQLIRARLEGFMNGMEKRERGRQLIEKGKGKNEDLER